MINLFYFSVSTMTNIYKNCSVFLKENVGQSNLKQNMYRLLNLSKNICHYVCSHDFPEIWKEGPTT